MDIEKCYNEEGRVGVLISPGYGSGWSTSWWDSTRKEVAEFLLFDKTLVEMCLRYADEDEVEDYLKSKGVEEEELYLGGWDGCVVYWLYPGTKFTVHQYDGSEFIVLEDHLDMEA